MSVEKQQQEFFCLLLFVVCVALFQHHLIHIYSAINHDCLYWSDVDGFHGTVVSITFTQRRRRLTEHWSLLNNISVYSVFNKNLLESFLYFSIIVIHFLLQLASCVYLFRINFWNYYYWNKLKNEPKMNVGSHSTYFLCWCF